MATLNNKILSKPGNYENAFKQLSEVSGKIVIFLTAVCIIVPESNKVYRYTDITKAKFRKLNDIIINNGASIAVPYASREIKKPKIEPVPVVRIIRQVNAKIPAGLENLLTFLSNMVHIYSPRTAANPEYRNIFQAKIDLKLYVVIATINLSGRPKSRTRIAKPEIRNAIANSAERGANGL